VQRRDAQRAARARAAALGIGCLHEMGGPDLGGEDDFTALLTLARDEPGPQVVGYWGELAAVDRARELGAHGCGGDLLVDGSLGSHTALLSAPYADAPTLGHAYLDPDDVARHLAACADAGLQPGFHATGDGALATVCAGLARDGRGSTRSGPVRVEHAECLDEATIAELASYRVVASVQPAFDARWGGPSGLYVERLGPVRARAMNPFAAMAGAGVPLAFGSDAPVTPLDPWGAVRAAVHHSTPAHAMTARAAFAAHTRGGWRATGSAATRDGNADAGVLVPGAPATLAVWSAGDLVVQTPDPRIAAWSTDLRAGVPGLPDLDGEPPVCLRTLVHGRTVYERPGAAPTT
jgi:predicted amidohydrolase YtcJ